MKGYTMKTQYILKVDYHSTGKTKVWLCDSKLQAQAHASEYHDIDDITAEVFEIEELGV